MCGLAQPALTSLTLAKAAGCRLFSSQCPLRQVGAPADICRRLERVDVPFDRLFDLTPTQLGERILRALRLLLKPARRDAETFSLTVPLVDPLPFAYFVRVESDAWLWCTAAAPVLLATTVVPSPSRCRRSSLFFNHSRPPRSSPPQGFHPISFDLLPKRSRRGSTGGIRCGRRTQCRRRIRHWKRRSLISRSSAISTPRALRRDGSMEVEGITAENQLVREGLAAGMGLLHNGVSAADRAAVVAAYRAGTLHVIAMTYEVEFGGDACDEVFVLGTQCGKSAGYGLTAEQFMKAGGWARGGVTIYAEPWHTDDVVRMLGDGLLVVSHLGSDDEGRAFLADVVAGEIATGGVADHQGAIDSLTQTYFYCRMRSTMTWCGLAARDMPTVSAFLSARVEDVVDTDNVLLRDRIGRRHRPDGTGDGPAQHGPLFDESLSNLRSFRQRRPRTS